MSHDRYKYKIFKPGQWVDAGLFTTGQIVCVDPEYPQYVVLRYGSELRDDNQRYTRMRLAGEEPGRSLKNIFRPGQWVRHDKWGLGTVLKVTDIILTIRFYHLVKRIAPGRSRMYVTPYNLPDMDLTDIIERRRIFFDTHPGRSNEYKPCPCCGYPACKPLFAINEWEVINDSCVICGWVVDDHFNPLPYEHMGVSYIDDSDEGYTLLEARSNYKKYHTIYQPENGDVFIQATKPELVKQRKELVTLFESLMQEEESVRIPEIWEAAQKLIDALKI